MSKTGLALAALYLALIAICLGFAFGGDGDPKGRFVFLQLPIAPRLALLQALGLLALAYGLRARTPSR